MNYKVQLESPNGFCLQARTVLLSWGYCKIILDVIVLPFMIVPLPDLIGMVVYSGISRGIFVIPPIVGFSVMSTHAIADIVFHCILLSGLYKKSVQRLSKYHEYTKMLWVFTPILAAVYTVLNVADLISVHRDVTSLLSSYVIYMVVSIIFQTIIALVVVNQINTIATDSDSVIGGKTSGSNTKIVLTIETVKEDTSNENDSDATEQVTDTTCEKAKLTV